LEFQRIKECRTTLQLTSFDLDEPPYTERYVRWCERSGTSRPLLLDLWELPEREYLCVAIDILNNIKKTLGPNDIILIENCITNKSWWDTVDGLATSIVGYLFEKNPSLQEEYAKKWNDSDNIWLNRSAILFQLHYKQKTNEALLYNLILNHASSSEFFIQKAIGWALREYSKTNATSVMDFIHNHNLKSLSKREGLKWLNKGKTTTEVSTIGKR
jgi:3-methyladenine DNA glycosylase AlkD